MTTTTANKASPKKTTKPATAAPSARKDAAPLIEKAVTAKPEKSKKTDNADKPTKIKKPKLVRDSFTIPKDEYQVIDSLKQRSAKLGQAMKKSELLRAGIKLLNTLDDVQFKTALANVPAIKTGRPKTK